jgi:NitT/TauT family transport system substrate-binding protein
MRHKHLSGGIAAAAALLLLAGCSGAGTTPAQSGDSDEPATLRVGTLPINNLAQLYVGIDQGFFEEENLEIEPVPQGGGGAVITALVADEIDVGWSSAQNTFIAASQGLPVRIVAPGTIGPDTPDAMTGQPVVVGTDSPIEAIEDLDGASIAVNARAGIQEVTISAALEKAGVDPAGVEWIEIPLPDMPAALAAGQVDAIAAPEPFYTQVISSGDGRAVFDAFYEAGASLPTGHWVAVEPSASQNIGVLERFNRAILKSNAYANENPEATREAISSFTEIPAEIVSVIGLATWADDVDVEGHREIEELTRRYGPADLKEIDPADLILQY